MVELEDVAFAYSRGGFALRVPRLTVAEGERVAVVGPSGSGKTTLLNLVAGLALPDRGTVRVAGTEVSSLGQAARRAFRARRVGFVFQDFALVDYLTARDNILFAHRITPGLRLDAAARERAETLATACGLGALMDRRPGALSRGEQQRVAICRALAASPSLVLADEATGNLDPENKALILELLFARAAEAGAALLAVTHDHELLSRFDRVVDFAAFRAAEGRAA